MLKKLMFIFLFLSAFTAINVFGKEFPPTRNSVVKTPPPDLVDTSAGNSDPNSQKKAQTSTTMVEHPTGSAIPEQQTSQVPAPPIVSTHPQREIVAPGTPLSSIQPPGGVPALTPKIPAKGKVIIDFQEGEIKTLIKIFSELLGKNFTYDETIKGSVSLIGEKEVTKAEAQRIFETSLEMMGYTVVYGWPVSKIVPISEVKNEGNLPVVY